MLTVVVCYVVCLSSVLSGVLAVDLLCLVFVLGVFVSALVFVGFRRLCFSGCFRVELWVSVCLRGWYNIDFPRSCCVLGFGMTKSWVGFVLISTLTVVLIGFGCFLSLPSCCSCC